MASDEPELDPRAELNALTRSLLAQVERLSDSGCSTLGESMQALRAAESPARADPVRQEPRREQAPQAHAARASEAVAPPPPAPARDPNPLSREEAVQRLTVLQEAVSACTRCGLHSNRTKTVFARGSGSVGLCFVGEGPGADEDEQGLPFVGKAGQLLDRMVVAMGMTRDEIYVCNIVKCRPPGNRKPEAEEMAACGPYLHEQLDLIAPQVIVALGATAVQGLLGATEGITRMRGRWKLYRGRIPVMPTFHPAYLLRQPEAKREVWADLQAVLKQLGRTAPPRQG